MKDDSAPLLVLNLLGKVVRIHKSSRSNFVYVTPTPGMQPGEMVSLGSWQKPKRVAGEIRYDPSLSSMLAYDGKIWRPIGNGS